LEQPITAQLITAFCSVVGGLVFGIFYDAAKVLRLRAKSAVCTVFCDVLVCFFGFFILFYLAMAPGKGESRIYICVCALLGSIVYFSLISRIFLGIFTASLSLIVKIAGIVRRPFDYLLKKLVKIMNFFKKLFQKLNLWYKMREIEKELSLKKSLKPPHNGRDDTHEIQTNRNCHNNRHSRDNRIRGYYLGIAKGSGFERTRNARPIARNGGQRPSDEHRASIRNRSQHGR